MIGTIITGAAKLAGGIASAVKENKAKKEAEKKAEEQRIHSQNLDQRMATYEGSPVYQDLYGGTLYAESGALMMPQAGGMPNAELEGGETFQPPIGQPQAIPEGAASHAQGGVSKQLPAGTMVFSDTLKVPGTKETFADAHKKLEKTKTKYQKAINDPQTTRIAKRTAQKNMDNVARKVKELFLLQQATNGGNQGNGPTRPPMDLSGLNVPQNASQGPSAQGNQPQYSDGGITRDTSYVNNRFGNMLPEVTSTMYSPETIARMQRALEGADLINNTYTKPKGPYSMGDVYSGMLRDTVPEAGNIFPFGDVRTPDGTPAAYPVSRSAYKDDLPAGSLPTTMPSTEVTPDINIPALGLINPNAAEIRAMHNDATVGRRTPGQTVSGAVPETVAGKVAATKGGAGKGTTPKETAPALEALSTRGLSGSDIYTRDPNMRMADAAARAVGGALPSSMIGKAAGPDATTLAGGRAAMPTEREAADNAGYTWAGRALRNLGNGFGEYNNPLTNALFGDARSQGLIGGVVEAMPAIYNLIQGASDPEIVEPTPNTAGLKAAADMKNVRYNIDPALEAIQQGFNTGRENLASRSRGEQMAGTASLQNNLTKALSQLYANKANAENQYRAQGNQMMASVGAQNAASQQQADQFNAMNRAMGSTMTGQGLGQLSSLYQQRRNDNAQREMDKYKFDIMMNMFGGLENTAWYEKMNQLGTKLGIG